MEIVVTFMGGKIGQKTGVAPLHVVVPTGNWDALATKIVAFAKRHLVSKGVDAMVYANGYGQVTTGDRIVANFQWKETA